MPAGEDAGLLLGKEIPILDYLSPAPRLRVFAKWRFNTWLIKGFSGFCHMNESCEHGPAKAWD
jgi:hypothetical protein